MIRKGIIGGTFNPIHIGHINIAYEAIYNLSLDKVVFMPNGNPPHKNNAEVADGKYRLDMIKLAIEEEEMFEISAYEINKCGVSYTYETLKYLKDKEPETQWFFISGVDCLMDLHKWNSPDEILKNCNLVVFSRSGYSKEEIFNQKKRIEQKYKKSIIYLDIPLIEISSTAIRNKVEKKQEFSYLVGNKVSCYIKKNKLYLGENYVD